MDVAARGLMPNSTRAALAAHLDEFAAGEVDKPVLAMIERVRGRFARSINAGPDEIAFTKNITEGLNIVAASLDWKPGDNLVLCPEIEHPANFYPWLNLQRLGVELRMVTARDGRVPVDEMASRIDSRTRLVTTATVSFAPGLRTDVRRSGAPAASGSHVRGRCRSVGGSSGNRCRTAGDRRTRVFDAEGAARTVRHGIPLCAPRFCGAAGARVPVAFRDRPWQRVGSRPRLRIPPRTGSAAV